MRKTNPLCVFHNISMGTFWGFGMSGYNVAETSKQGRHGILCLCSYNAYFILCITANDLKEKSHRYMAMHTFYCM